MEYLERLWEPVKPVLTNSIVKGVLIGILVALILSLFKKAREVASQVWTYAISLLRVGRGWVFKGMGLVTRDELEKFTQGPVKKPPSRIERQGYVFYLDEEIHSYLGYVSPDRVGPATVDQVIQGPFCLKCVNLLSNEARQQFAVDIGNKVVMVWEHCPTCEPTEWAQQKVIGSVLDVKINLYRRLDAEMRLDREIKPILDNDPKT